MMRMRVVAHSENDGVDPSACTRDAEPALLTVFVPVQHMAASGRVHAWPLRVVEKIPECADVVTVVFDDPARHVVSFEAGQYLTVQAPIPGRPVPRTLSLSAPP